MLYRLKPLPISEKLLKEVMELQVGGLQAMVKDNCTFEKEDTIEQKEGKLKIFLEEFFREEKWGETRTHAAVKWFMDKSKVKSQLEQLCKSEEPSKKELITNISDDINLLFDSDVMQ